MGTAISISNIMNTLSVLSINDKRWIADSLYEQIEKSESVSNTKDADRKWIEDFLAMPHNYKQTAEEAKETIRKNRQFGVTRIIKEL